MTTKFEPFKGEDVVNKANLDTEICRVQSHLLHIENFFNEFKDPERFKVDVLTGGAENNYSKTL